MRTLNSRAALRPTRIARLLVGALLGAVAGGGCAATINPRLARLADAPNDPALHLALAEEASRDGDLLRAEQYYVRAQALGADPDRVTPSLLGVLVRGHRYADAVARCDERLRARPADRATRYLRAVLLRAVDRWSEAEQELLALSAAGGDPDVHFELAALYAQSGDGDRARREWTAYLQAAPQGALAAEAHRLLASEQALGAKAPEGAHHGP